MSESDDTPKLVCTRAGRSTKVNVGVRIGGRIAATFPRVDVVDPAVCEKLAGGLLKRFQGLEHQNVLEELTAAAELVLEPCAAPKPKQADLLMACAADVELFHDGDEAYATIPVRQHFETYTLKTKGFRAWLTDRFYQEHKSAPNSEAITAAVNVLRAKAIHDGSEHAVHVRLAAHSDAIVLDLADSEWRAVQIDATGWRIVDRSPVKFRRPRGMLALPAPVAGGSVSELRALANIPDDDTWALTAAWMVGALSPRGPYPLLAVQGEQGSAKSTTCRLMRATIDPSAAPLQSPPRDERDLMIAAESALVVALDNVSYLPPWLSDALCRLATGGGFATRELYSDREQAIFSAARPALLNGIVSLATRSDLADRCISVHLPMIPERRRRPESELLSMFEAARPRILGALLDALSVGLRRLPSVRLARLPRMADFARWAVAAEPGLYLPDGAIMRAYADCREAAHAEAVELSMIGPPLRALLNDRAEWRGTARELLAALTPLASETTRRAPDWPRTARAMGAALRRLAPDLRAMGWHVDQPTRPTGRGKRCVITLRPPPADDRQTDADDWRMIAPHQSPAPGAPPCGSVRQRSAGAVHADDADDCLHTLSGSDDVEVMEL